MKHDTGQVSCFMLVTTAVGAGAEPPAKVKGGAPNDI